jgi:tellurite resistance-related uncharacterized protein
LTRNNSNDMQTPSALPHGYSWVDLLPYVLGVLIGVSTRWIPLWQDRKKPDAVVHETHARAGRAEAETRKLDAEAGKSFGEAIVALSDKITESHNEIYLQRERHIKQVEFIQGRVEFLQEQVEHKTADEQKARERSHRAVAEVQRCILTIRDYEERMRNCKSPIEFTPFKFKSYENIMDGKE